ncbi:MAG: hypothetical protein WBA39_05265 [Rivularia sp. (in: cyanobacteria)]
MGRWGDGVRGFGGDGESFEGGSSVSRSTSEVALAQRGVSLTRRGRWGTRGQEDKGNFNP